jgi:hypothetical protein
MMVIIKEGENCNTFRRRMVESSEWIIAIIGELKTILSPPLYQGIVYYGMRSKNEVLCAAVGRLAAERSEADKPAKAHKTTFAPNYIYYFFFKPS